jgi:hypothetical protein
MLTSQGIQPEKEIRERVGETIDPIHRALIEFVESLRVQEEMKQIKLHNHRNARRRIQRKKFLESEKKVVEIMPTTKKVWRKMVSSSGTPSGDNNRTKGMESLAPDSKPDPSP